jgi:hypothetical protein
MSQVPSKFARRTGFARQKAAVACPLAVEHAIAALISTAIAGIVFSLMRALADITVGV